MKLQVLAAVSALLLSSCSTTTVDLSSKANAAQSASIYIPDSFIKKIDSETIQSVIPGDTATIVQLIRVDPGTHIAQARIEILDNYYGLNQIYKIWEFKFRFAAEPRRTYYFWYEKSGGAPILYGQDLGENFNLESRAIAPAFGFRSQEQLDSERKYRLSLRTKGTPIAVEILSN